jgi:hypothetical protein
MTSFEDKIRSLAQLYQQTAPKLIMCSPDQQEAVQALVEEIGLGNLWMVRPSYLCPPDKFYLLDANALRLAIGDAFDFGPPIPLPPKES